MIDITEESGVHKEWYKEAREVSLDNLPEFINRICNGFNHDYGTICHAIAASSIAAAWAAEKTPQGGITGFQAGAIMWEFIKNWQSYDGPMRLLQYNEMLYPQMEDKFNEISKDIWEHLQNEAKKKLDEKESLHPNVKSHMESIVAGKIPFGYKLKKERE